MENDPVATAPCSDSKNIEVDELDEDKYLQSAFVCSVRVDLSLAE